jgi:hypothetical protein
MKNKGNVLFGLVMIAFTSMASAQGKAKQIDELMRRYVDNGQFNAVQMNLLALGRPGHFPVMMQSPYTVKSQL